MDVGFQCKNDRASVFVRTISPCTYSVYSLYCSSIISHEYLAASNTKLYPICFIERTLNRYESVISEKTKRNRED